jgi:AbiV family abortive infection protein
MATSRNQQILLPQYHRGLSAVDAANAIRAARQNAADLLDTAEILFTLKRFAHSMAFSTLAIEESSKLPVLMWIFFSDDAQEQAQRWKSYRSHRAKTADLNRAIESRVRATFPQVPPEEAKQIAEAGPAPKELEYNKQLAIYSDCLDEAGAFISHLPRLSEWRSLAWDRLCEARALVYAMRDRVPEELTIMKRHMRQRLQSEDPVAMMKKMHEELLQKGFAGGPGSRAGCAS